MKPQEPPFCVQVELSEGCNLFCDFCGLQGIRNKGGENLRFMTLATAQRLASEIARLGWTARLEFAMHGEPTMNPEFLKIMCIFRQNLPDNNIMVTSNGGGMLQDTKNFVKKMFRAGVNTVALDEYESVKIGTKLRRKLGLPMSKEQPYLGSLGGIEFWNYPAAAKEANPHQRRQSKKRFIFVKDISVAETGNHSHLNNHCGAGMALNDKGQGKKCAKPFRELSVRFAGDVSICCNDWRGIYKIGNINQMPLGELWNSDAFQVARKYMFHGMRDFKPCFGCDALSFRVGFLPDKMGKRKNEIPKPTKEDKKVVGAALRGGPYTKPVERPWEKKGGSE